jgi:hypothetical protein
VPARSRPSFASRPAAARRSASGVGVLGFRVRAWACAVVAIALGAVIASNLLDLKAYGFRIRVLDANWEFSWSHDVDTLVLAVGMLITAVGARRHPRQRTLWTAAAVIMALFVLDEASPLHAEIGHASKLLYAPTLAALALCVWLLVKRTAERATLILGLATLSVCFGMHVVGLTLLRPIGYLSVPYQSGVGVKEGTELAGLMLVVLALWPLARGVQPRVPGPVA